MLTCSASGCGRCARTLFGMTHYGLDPSRLTLVADAQSALGEVRIGREPASRAARGRPAKPKVEAALTCREMVADAPANRSG